MSGKVVQYGVVPHCILKWSHKNNVPHGSAMWHVIFVNLLNVAFIGKLLCAFTQLFYIDVFV